RPIEERRADGARLRDERDASALRHRLAEARVELRGRAQHAEAVRSDEPDAVRPGDAKRLVLERAAARAGLAEAAGQDHGRANPGLAAFAEHVGHDAGRRDDQREVRRAADVAYPRVAAQALHA